MPAHHAAKFILFSIRRLLFLQSAPRSSCGPTTGAGSQMSPKQRGHGSPPGTSKVSKQPPGHLCSPQPGHLIDRAIPPQFLFPLIKSVFSNRERKATKCFLLRSFSTPHKPLVASVSLLQPQDLLQSFKPSLLLKHRTFSISPLRPLPHYPITHPSSCICSCLKTEGNLVYLILKLLRCSFSRPGEKDLSLAKKRYNPL